MNTPREDLLWVEEALWVLTAPTGKAIYDFAFDRLLACRRPYQLPPTLTAVARVGAPDYDAFHQRWAAEGVHLIHTPEQHRRASELPRARTTAVRAPTQPTCAGVASPAAAGATPGG